MKLSQFLKQGEVEVDLVKERLTIEGFPLTFPFHNLTKQDWGYIFEKYVGQHYEKEGYNVEYKGLTQGFLDSGIDLLCESSEEIICVQCKFTMQKIGKSKIEHILYKTSKFLSTLHDKTNKPITFCLAIIDTHTNFTKRKVKSMDGGTPLTRWEYPLLNYFLSKNHIQNKIKVQCREFLID